MKKGPDANVVPLDAFDKLQAILIALDAHGVPVAVRNDIVKLISDVSGFTRG